MQCAGIIEPSAFIYLSVFTVTPSKKQIPNHSITEAKNFKWYKRLINNQLLQVSGLYRTVLLSFLPKRSMQVYRAQYADAILVPSEGHQHGSQKSMKTSGTYFCYEIDYFSLLS